MEINIENDVRIDLNRVVKVAFEKDDSSPLGQRADLFVPGGEGMAQATPRKVDSIPALQQLREVVGSGSGETRWVRVRQEGSTGDRQDAYANLDAVRRVEFGEAADGAIARLEAENGMRIGEVHLPAALQAVRSLKLPER